jgi:hypothetical protein
MPMLLMLALTLMLLLDVFYVTAYAAANDANADMQKCRMLLAILMVPMPCC